MSLADHDKTSTLPKLLQCNAEQDPKAAGIREKTRGVWQTYSWSAYRDNVRDFALVPISPPPPRESFHSEIFHLHDLAASSNS